MPVGRGFGTKLAGVVTALIALPLALAASAVGCDTMVHQPLADLPDARPSAKCVEATFHSDYPWLRDNLFKPSCAAFAACHGGARPSANLDLTAAAAYGSLVNVASSQVMGWQRVVPGDPDHSYLLVKLGGLVGPLGDGGDVMPPNSVPICAEKVAAVRRWIAAGAKIDPNQPDAGP